MTLPEIADVICKYFKVSLEYINQKDRKREIIEKRQIAHYFAKQETRNSLQEIGDYFGLKSHAAVLHSIKVVNNLIDTDPIIRNIIDKINHTIHPPDIILLKRHSRRLVARLKFMCN